MKIENTKWGSQVVFDNGRYLRWDWKAMLLIVAIIIVVALIFS